MKTKSVIMLSILFISINLMAQPKSDPNNLEKHNIMKTYLIEREIPNVGELSSEDLRGISQKSCVVIREMGANKIQWLYSYVTKNKVYCVYKAYNKETIKKHAELGGFPANNITEISSQISPKTAN